MQAAVTYASILSHMLNQLSLREHDTEKVPVQELYRTIVPQARKDFEDMPKVYVSHEHEKQCALTFYTFRRWLFKKQDCSPAELFNELKSIAEGVMDAERQMGVRMISYDMRSVSDLVEYYKDAAKALDLDQDAKMIIIRNIGECIGWTDTEFSKIFGNGSSR